MEPNTCHRTPPPPEAPPRSGGENGAILALPPIPGRHRMSPNPQERSPAQARNAGSGSKPSLSFPRGKPGLPLGSSEMGDCQKSCRALRPEKPAPTPQPRTLRPRVAGKSGLGVADPSSRRPPSPRTRPPCERCLPPAASRSPRRRPGRPASPRGSSPPAARAEPAWKPRPAQVPPRRCAGSPAVLSSRVAGAGRLKGRGAEPSVRNLSLPNRRPRRLQRTAVTANQSARKEGWGRPGPAHPTTESLGNAVAPGNRPDQSRAAGRGADCACAPASAQRAEKLGKKEKSNSQTQPARPSRRLRGRLAEPTPRACPAPLGPAPKAIGRSEELVRRNVRNGVLNACVEQALVPVLHQCLLSLLADAGSALTPARVLSAWSAVTEGEVASRTFPRSRPRNPTRQSACRISHKQLLEPPWPPGPAWPAALACFLNQTLARVCAPCRAVPAMGHAGPSKASLGPRWRRNTLRFPVGLASPSDTPFARAETAVPEQ